MDNVENSIIGDNSNSPEPVSFMKALVCGGLAGTSVDVALFPIDTLKTRLQSPQGFLTAGGFRGIYNGIGVVAIGSAPGAALFFSTYEVCVYLCIPRVPDFYCSSHFSTLRCPHSKTLKPIFTTLQDQFHIQPENDAISHMAAASVGEAAACLVRVPTEVIKAKMQTGTGGTGGGLVATIQLVLQEKHGGGSFLTPYLGGLYRGFGITLMREIPFAMIQFPLYERFKAQWSNYQDQPVSPVQAAACGSLAGGIAAGATTPLDVIKTRLMLGADQHGEHYKNAIDVVRRTMAEEPRKFLSGIQPRVMWISIGGFVFFGAYEQFKSLLDPILM